MRKYKIKKVIAIIGVLAMLFSAVMAFVACDRKYIIIGIVDEYEPFSYKNAVNEFVGFDVGYICLLEQELGVKVKLESINWLQAEELLNQGKVDALWNFSKTPERAKRVLFSDNYFLDSSAVVIRQTMATGIECLDDFKAIAAQKISTQDEWLTQNNLDDKVVYCKNFLEVMQKLETNVVDAAIVDLAFAQHYIKYMQNDESEKLAIYIDNLYSITCNVAVKQGNQQLLDTLNGGIALVNESDSYQILCNKWFGKADGFR